MLLDLGNEDTWTSLSPGSGSKVTFIYLAPGCCERGEGGLCWKEKNTNTFDIFKILVKKQLE